MSEPPKPLRTIYLEYISCLNAQTHSNLSNYVAPNAIHNGRTLGLSGYTDLIRDSFATYTWLHFNVGMLVVDDENQTVAARLILRGTDPHASDVEREHVFYRFREGKIAEVWSMLEGF